MSYGHAASARSAAQAEPGKRMRLPAAPRIDQATRRARAAARRRALPCLASVLAFALNTSARADAGGWTPAVRGPRKAEAKGRFAYAAETAAAVESVRDVWPVPAELVQAVIRQESNFDPGAQSPAGAVGLMQVMPFNAAKLGVTEAELWEPGKNVLAGTRLLAVLLKHYEGDLISALAAYNAKPRKLFAALPNNGETPEYVRAVLRYYRDCGGTRARAPARQGPGATDGGHG